MAGKQKKQGKGYDFAEVEAKIKKIWEDEKTYSFDPSQKRVYSIDTPPPTVSGAMHIGHAFSYSQQDFIARYRRMNGPVFYPFGTDDNGIPTERLVERLKNVKSLGMKRGDFISLCLETLKEITPDFIQDWKNLGISADYSIYYSTIDEDSRRIAQKVFIDLFTRGEIYKAGFPVIWCPECQTSIAQAELEDVNRSTKLVYLKGKLEDGSFIIYATTRPELHPGCIGISLDGAGDYVRVRHGDETWIVSKDSMQTFGSEFGLRVIEELKGKDLVGKPVEIAFAKGPVTISHDVSAKTEYGTGVVYYCSYGGLDCVQWLGRHPDVKAIDVMGEDGTYTTEPIKGLKSPEARKKIVALLDEKGLVIKQENMAHAVNTHDKCGTDVEYISAPQWFVKIIDKKDLLLKQGEAITWHPAHMRKRYENWIKGLSWDWNISRNRHFGVPIPAWTCTDCNKIFIAGEAELPVDPLQTNKNCPNCGTKAVPESMVLDTWATSSLTPRIASQIVDGSVAVPYSLRPQGHDIIRTWAFYTIVQALLEDGSIPWNNIVISGMVTQKGEKMSKSKGNSISPHEVMREYGADALRFWAAASKLGGDLDYQEQDLIAGKKTITKLVNASKFVFMNLEDYSGEKPKKLEAIDQAFLDELDFLVKRCTDAFEKYEYSVARSAVDRFFWGDFADNYIEIVKKRIYNEIGDKKTSAQYALYQGLLTIVKLFAPFMPFVTEDVYQTYFKKSEGAKSIHVSLWPRENKKAKNSEDFAFFVALLGRIRSEKTKAQKSMNSEIILSLSQEELEKLGDMKEDLASVVAAKEIKEGKFGVGFV